MENCHSFFTDIVVGLSAGCILQLTLTCLPEADEGHLKTGLVIGFFPEVFFFLHTVVGLRAKLLYL